VPAVRLNEIVRQHRELENQQHPGLNVVMNEDQDGTRSDNIPLDLAARRHIAALMERLFLASLSALF
jgi:predicted transposase YbfD/YdcC